MADARRLNSWDSDDGTKISSSSLAETKKNIASKMDSILNIEELLDEAEKIANDSKKNMTCTAPPELPADVSAPHQASTFPSAFVGMDMKGTDSYTGQIKS